MFCFINNHVIELADHLEELHTTSSLIILMFPNNYLHIKTNYRVEPQEALSRRRSSAPLNSM